MSEVNVFKLASSEEIICTVLSEEADHFVIEKAMQVGPQQNAEGMLQLQWMPFIWTDVEATKTITLYKSCVMGRLTEFDENIRKEYVTKTSGIVLASAGDIK